MYLSPSELTNEFDRQINNLLHKKYPDTANLSQDAFLKYIELLRLKLSDISVHEKDLDKGKLPFVIVVSNKLIPSEKMMMLVERESRNGVTVLRPHTSKNFKTIAGVSIPDKNIYLLVDIDRGKENINLPPNEAMKLIAREQRSPLTIDEGIAIVTQYPQFLMKNNCYSLLASRTGTDQRVPAIWINSKKEPNLGWCWDGNPHTWLGSASCVMRIG